MKQTFNFYKTYDYCIRAKIQNEFENDFKQFIIDNNVFTDDLEPSNFEKAEFETPMGLAIAIMFKARLRNQDDEIRERIEFQIKNLQ